MSEAAALYLCESCDKLYSGHICACGAGYIPQYHPDDVSDNGHPFADAVPINQPIPAGIKHDQGKPRMDLIAPELQTALAEILTFGAAKYNDRNWETGMRWGKVFAALMRHLWDWWAKKGPDPETGKSHLWHAGCCIMFLVAYEARNIGQDDRP
jgi:hypothetical protein